MLKEAVRDTGNYHRSKGLSPLKAKKVIRFQCASRQRNGQRITVGTYLSKLMTTLGKECAFEVSEIQKETSAAGDICANVNELATRKGSVLVQIDASTQTENSVCEECQKRSEISRIDTDTQTNNTRYYDVGYQVERIERRKLQTNVLREHSLASLTPAQLLRCEDYFGAKRKRYSEFPSEAIDRRNDSVSASDVLYGDKCLSLGGRRDQTCSNRLYNRDRPQFLNTFQSKSVPFSNFDPSLKLNLSSSFMCKYK